MCLSGEVTADCIKERTLFCCEMSYVSAEKCTRQHGTGNNSIVLRQAPLTAFSSLTELSYKSEWNREISPPLLVGNGGFFM